MVYLVLAVGGAGGALWLAYLFDLPVAATAVALLPTTAGLYLSWAALRASRSAPASPPSLDLLADQLATVVRRQWEVEAGVRGLHDPRPLTVKWTAAPEHLVEDWALLTQTAEEQRAGTTSDPAGWAAAPAELPGGGGRIVPVFRDLVPTRRLVVLGEPGSGKTMMLVRLLLGLAECRAPGTPVPVLFTLSSWDPLEQDLESYLAQRLTQDFEELAYASAPSFNGLTRARALLANRLILPLLDGFDELPARLRGPALDRINSGLPPGQGVVLSSRTAEYEEAALPATGLPRKLAGAAGIELLALGPEETAAYLRRDAGGAGTPAASRWERVLHSLGTDGPVAQALSTPLIVFMARTIYNPRTGEPLEEVASPDELLDIPALSTRQAVEAHLFEAFVPAAYRPHPDKPSPWSAADAERALRWLARHTERVRAGATDLAWWQLSRSTPHWLPLVLTGLLAGALESFITWVTMQVGDHFPTWLDQRDGRPGVDWSEASSGGLIAGLVGGLAGRLPGGLIGGLIGAMGLAIAMREWGPGGLSNDITWQLLTTGLVYGFVGGLMGELTLGMRARRSLGDPTTETHRHHRPRNRWVALAGASVGAGYGLWGSAMGIWLHSPVSALIGSISLACLFGIAGARAAGYGSPRNDAPPAADVTWAWDRGGLLVGLGGGLAAIFPSWMINWFGTGFPEVLLGDLEGLSGLSLFGSANALGILSLYCLAGSITYGIRASAADLTRAPSPTSLLTRDRRAFWRIGWLSALTVGLVLAVPAWYASSLQVSPGTLENWTWHDIEWQVTTPQMLRALLTGALVGIAVGLAVAWNQTACGTFTIARCYLTTHHRLPWRLMAFLADAHQHRGVLRQSGAAYQFRHVELQRRLAALPGCVG
ncbi:NACHT domain-containing protein [Streptomyces sp. bgisy034]|uniref:NACHT domain-containing protein n=1 Tax=Streptomyces sp. bgisy034 TaxID=3413774 RepID=UPI003EBFB9AC